VDDELKPVHPDAQRSVPVPENLLLDQEFFKEEEAPLPAFAPASATTSDPYALAASYKDDLGFMAARNKQQNQQAAASTTSSNAQSSMFYLGKSKDATAAGGSPSDTPSGDAGQATAAAPTDPLERMRAQIMAGRSGASGVKKMEVMRDDVVLPNQQQQDVGTTSQGQGIGSNSISATPSGTMTLPIPAEKDLTDLQGRLWSACYRDDNIAVYCCVRAKNVKKQLLRIDLRCERIAQDAAALSLADVALAFPAGVTLQDGAGGQPALVNLVVGQIEERSAKVRANLSLQPFQAPIACKLACELRYNLNSAATTAPLELHLQASSFLSPLATNEDEIAEYIQNNRELMNEQVSQIINLTAAGKSVEQVTAELPGIVGRCAGLSNFSGIQQQSTGKDGQPSRGQKFLLVALPPAASVPPVASALPNQDVALPHGARIVCLCAALPKEGALDVRLTVKSARKDVSTDVCDHLAVLFREVVEGRLR
jgi:hypothetical protein